MNWSSVYEMRGSADLWWFNKANDLRGAAAAIWDAIEKEPCYIKDTYGLDENYSFGIALPGVFAMNCGLSIELILKALIVLNNKGKFEDVPTNHKLLNLAKNADVLKLLNDDQKVLLEVLTEYIYWIGKYPVAKSFDAQEQTSEIMNKISQPSQNLFLSVNEKRRSNWQNYNELWSILFKEYWRQKDNSTS